MTQLPNTPVCRESVEHSEGSGKNLLEKETGVVRAEGCQRAAYILPEEPRYILQIISREKGTHGSVLTMLMVTCSYGR